MKMNPGSKVLLLLAACLVASGLIAPVFAASQFTAYWGYPHGCGFYTSETATNTFSSSFSTTDNQGHTNYYSIQLNVLGTDSPTIYSTNNEMYQVALQVQGGASAMYFVTDAVGSFGTAPPNSVQIPASSGFQPFTSGYGVSLSVSENAAHNQVVGTIALLNQNGNVIWQSTQNVPKADFNDNFYTIQLEALGYGSSAVATFSGYSATIKLNPTGGNNDLTIVGRVSGQGNPNIPCYNGISWASTENSNVGYTVVSNTGSQAQLSSP
jgi:hypothetical protein